jgi:hypothetical protein
MDKKAMDKVRVLKAKKKKRKKYQKVSKYTCPN